MSSDDLSIYRKALQAARDEYAAAWLKRKAIEAEIEQVKDRIKKLGAVIAALERLIERQERA